MELITVREIFAQPDAYIFDLFNCYSEYVLGTTAVAFRHGENLFVAGAGRYTSFNTRHLYILLQIR